MTEPAHENQFNLVASIHNGNATVIGMRGPYMLFDTPQLAADYLQDFADSLRRHGQPATDEGGQ